MVKVVAGFIRTYGKKSKKPKFLYEKWWQKNLIRKDCFLKIRFRRLKKHILLL